VPGEHLLDVGGHCGSLSDCLPSAKGLLAALAAVLIVVGIAAILFGSGGAATPAVAALLGEGGGLALAGTGTVGAAGAISSTAAQLVAEGAAVTVGGMMLAEAAEGMPEPSGTGSTASSSSGSASAGGDAYMPQQILDNPSVVRGRSPEEVSKMLDDGLNRPGDPLGSGWTRMPVKKGEGTRWVQTRPNTGRSFSIERQPQVDEPLHQGWYLKVAKGGPPQRIPLQGNPTLGGAP
jgi:hypothetical protein